jgi:hypothetical protein
MQDWIPFADRRPSQGEFIVAITHRGTDLPIEVWEKDLERNAVGVWIDGEVWEGDRSSTGFTHWMALPDRPTDSPKDAQLRLWDILGKSPFYR